MSNYDVRVVAAGEEQDEEILEMLKQAEQDAGAEGAQVRVNFRWGADQIARVKEAARIQGLPYQVYIKKALYDRASSDLEAHFRLESARREDQIARAEIPR